MKYRTETIGDQTLILGDCREVMPTLGKFDACVTDPPYGISFTSSQPNSIKYEKIINDDVKFNPSIILELLIPSIVFGANNFADLMPVGGWIVWDKRCTESADKMMGSPFELAWCSNKKLFRIIRVQHGGAKNADSPNGDASGEARHHPTQKPIIVMRKCIEFLGNANTILDPFMGSGSTLVACQQLGRKGTGIELSEKYFDIACRRVEQAANQPRLFSEPVQKIKQEAFI